MKNQMDFIVQELKSNGRISRNKCLANYISRLGAYIVKLKKIGWEFRTSTENGDFVYTVVKTPFGAERSYYTTPNIKTAQNANLSTTVETGGTPQLFKTPKRWIE